MERRKVTFKLYPNAREAERCRRAFKFDHLCALNFDQV